MDRQQKVFEDFEVPDPIRISKALDFVRNYFESIEGLNVLDCGVTKGGFADLLSREGAICHGIDINRREMPGIEIVQADLNKGMPKFDKEFDLVCAGELIEHIYDDDKFIRQCNDLLRPNGLFIATVPNLVFIVNRILMLIGKLPRFVYAPYHYHIYTKTLLQDLLARNGFEVIKFSSSHLLFSTRRNKLGRCFELLGDIFPTLGAHLIVFAKKL